MSRGTANALDVLYHHRVQIFLDNPGCWFFSGWEVLTFGLEHDAAEPLGFFIGHENDRLLFIPDTAYVKNRFKGVTILAVECNHVSNVLSENILSGSVPSVVGRRIRRNHMSLQTVKEMILANDLSQCRQIYLLHLSDGNSDEQRMKKEIQEITGIPVYVA